MANAIVPQTRTKQVTMDLAITAGTLVKLAHKHDASLHRAIDKAAPRLIDMPWRIVEGRLEIASVSSPDEVHHCGDEFCTCPTVRDRKDRHVWCWHSAAWLILSTLAATGVTVEAALPLMDPEAWDDLAGIVPVVDHEMARVQALVDELF